MTVLDAAMVVQGVTKNAGLPYGPVLPATVPGRRIQLVPYLAWGNRTPGQTMRVWIPEEVKSNDIATSPQLDDKPAASMKDQPNGPSMLKVEELQSSAHESSRANPEIT
jgi:hypothetical protein